MLLPDQITLAVPLPKFTYYSTQKTASFVPIVLRGAAKEKKTGFFGNFSQVSDPPPHPPPPPPPPFFEKVTII